MSKAIVFTSGKGGVGKSTLTLSVGKELCALGNKVVLVDTDIGLNNLDVLMDVEQKIFYDLTDIIENRCRLSQALIEDNVVKGLYLLPSVRGYDQCKANGQNFREVVLRLKNIFDFVLIDCPAGIEFGFHRSVQAADEAIVVTSPHLSALKDAAKVAALIGSYKLKAKLVINRYRGDLLLNGESLSVEEITDAMGVDVLGVIPEDDDINLISSGEKISKRSPGKIAISMLAHNINYGTDDIYDVTKKYRGFLGAIKRKLRGKV